MRQKKQQGQKQSTATPAFLPPTPITIPREVHTLSEANSYDWSYVNLDREMFKWVFQCGFPEEVGEAYFECRGPSPIGWFPWEEKEKASSTLASLFLSGCDNIHWCLPQLLRCGGKNPLKPRAKENFPSFSCRYQESHWMSTAGASSQALASHSWMLPGWAPTLSQPSNSHHVTQHLRPTLMSLSPACHSDSAPSSLCPVPRQLPSNSSVSLCHPSCPHNGPTSHILAFYKWSSSLNICLPSNYSQL